MAKSRTPGPDCASRAVRVDHHDGSLIGQDLLLQCIDGDIVMGTPSAIVVLWVAVNEELLEAYGRIGHYSCVGGNRGRRVFSCSCIPGEMLQMRW